MGSGCEVCDSYKTRSSFALFWNVATEFCLETHILFNSYWYTPAHNKYTCKYLQYTSVPKNTRKNRYINVLYKCEELMWNVKWCEQLTTSWVRSSNSRRCPWSSRFRVLSYLFSWFLGTDIRKQINYNLKAKRSIIRHLRKKYKIV